MIRIAVAVLLAAVCVSGLTPRNDPYWAAYKARFAKAYPSDTVELSRYEAFLASMAEAEHLNVIDPSATYTWTHLSDRIPTDRAGGGLEVPQDIVRTEIPPRNAPLPAAFDWRNYGAVTPIQNQAQCGSCWAFSSVVAMEGAHFRKNGVLVGLSEQQLVDCDTTNNGCNGGWPTKAMEWIRTHGGIARKADYPYLQVRSTCAFAGKTVAARMETVMTFTARNAEAIKQALVSYGPLAAAVDSRKYYSYGGGIMGPDGCYSGMPSHGVAIIGWGVQNGVQYWTVKNSWDTWWGENGYVRMQLGVNACGIEDYPMGVVAVKL